MGFLTTWKLAVSQKVKDSAGIVSPTLSKEKIWKRTYQISTYHIGRLAEGVLVILVGIGVRF
jgi:hypothetical protein